MAPLTTALGFVAIAGAGAANLRIHRRQDPSIPFGGEYNRTGFPSNWNDYTRGHLPLPLYPKGSEPGNRSNGKAPGVGLPAFDAANRSNSPQWFTDSHAKDVFGMKCAPGGQSYGHNFYNVWEPEIIKFVVPVGTEGRKDTTVVIAPGGGGVHLAWEPEGTAVAEWLNSIGISAFVVKYRVPDATYELMLSDVQRAMSLVRSQAETLQLNPKRIGFAGFAAGGALGMWLGERVKRNYARIDEIDDVDFHANFLILGYPEVFPSMYQKMKLLPPTFITLSDNDKCAPAAITRFWAHTLTQKYNSTPMEIKRFVNGDHGWATCELYSHLKGHRVCSWKKHAIKFLEDHDLLDRSAE